MEVFKFGENNGPPWYKINGTWKSVWLDKNQIISYFWIIQKNKAEIMLMNCIDAISLGDAREVWIIGIFFLRRFGIWNKK